MLSAGILTLETTCDAYPHCVSDSSRIDAANALAWRVVDKHPQHLGLRGAQLPEDWDDEEDGDWVPPTVPNPKCDEVSGCGKWERPMTKNPAYKGKWTPEFIDNPAYKGIWAPRKIKNPDYFEDKTPANFEPIGAVSLLDDMR